MNTISSIPCMKLSNEPNFSGLNQFQVGSMWPGGAEPLATLTSATIANTSRMVTSTTTSVIWILAEISIPRQHSQVSTTIQPIPSSSTQMLVASLPIDFAPISSHTYWAPTCE